MKDKGAGFISQMVDETLANYRLNLLSSVNASHFTCTITNNKSFILKCDEKELEVPMNFPVLKKLNSSESYQIEKDTNNNDFIELLISYFGFDDNLSKLTFVKNFEIENEFLIYQEFIDDFKEAA